jgi:biopolymer transport protein ExbD
MKLVSTLPERPGLLHAVPVLNLFALLLVFLLLGPSFVTQSGVAVDLPISQFQLGRIENATVITLTAGDPPGLWLEREEVSLSKLDEKLQERRSTDAGAPMSVLIKADSKVPYSTLSKVVEMAIHKGFRVYQVGAAKETESNQ